MFLDWQNTTKSLSSSFSCLFEEEIAETLKKFNSHDGFLSYLQDRTAIQAHLAAIYCPVLVCPQKSHHGKLNFILYRINSQLILSNSYWAPIIFKLSAKSIYSLSFTGDRTYSQLLKTGFLSLPHFFSY